MRDTERHRQRQRQTERGERGGASGRREGVGAEQKDDRAQTVMERGKLTADIRSGLPFVTSTAEAVRTAALQWLENAKNANLVSA